MRHKLSKKIAFAVAVAIISYQFSLIGCSDFGLKLPKRESLDEAHYQKQGIVLLPFEQLSRAGSHITASDQYNKPLDDDSIEMFSYRGSLYYHPVNLCHRIYTFIGTYHTTGDSRHLDRAVKYTAKLIDMLEYHNEAAYLPYQMRYAVHADSSITFPAPWYSGMAQGEFLGILVRMYEISGNKDYLVLADDIFLTLKHLAYNHDEWVSRLDESGYYWIEEYPHDVNPGMTLNGFIFALYGVYDYYRVTENPEALRIWELSITTLKHYLPIFERRGRTSLYCIGHLIHASEGYHNIHIAQTEFLYRMTGDVFFRNMQELLEEDGRAVFGIGNAD